MRSISVCLSVGALLGIGLIQAKDKRTKPSMDRQDSIEVVGHIPVSGRPITRFFTTRHFRSFYLYAEHESGHGLTLLDVTRADRPALLADIPSGSAGQPDIVAAVAGTAVILTDLPEPAVSPTGRTVRVMDLSDPRQPKVTREFSGVTATARDESRGLIFVANGEGIWILQQNLAEDPAMAKAYGDYVIYGPSMFPPGK